MGFSKIKYPESSISGAIVAAIGSTSNTGPLSEKNIIIVFSNISLDSIALIIFPISRSNVIILAAYFLSFSSLILKSSFITLFSASIGVCGALKATYRNRGLELSLFLIILKTPHH